MAVYTDNGTNTPNGSHLEFTYTFPTIKTDGTDVKVALNGQTQATNKYTVTTTSPTKITFNSTDVDSTLQESTGAPKTGVTVRVFRDTYVDAAEAVYAAGSSIRAADLNNNQDQVLFALQEEQQLQLNTEDIANDAITGDKLADNIDIAGTLDVTGIGTFDSDLIIKADNKGFIVKNASGTNQFVIDSNNGDVATSGDGDIGGDLSVIGSTTLTGATTLKDNVTLKADSKGFTVQTAAGSNKFTIDSDNGNTVIAGNLDVDGATTLDGTTVDGVLDVNGSATIDNVQVNGNEIDTTSGGLTIDSASGTTTIDDKLL